MMQILRGFPAALHAACTPAAVTEQWVAIMLRGEEE